jgi:type VI protein secretion system component Hcp
MPPKTQYFLKLELAGGVVQGESQEDGHVGEIDIESFHVSGQRNGLVGQAGVRLCTFQDVRLTMKLSKAGPKLMNALQDDKSQAMVKLATLTCRREAQGGAQDFLVWKMGPGFIASFDVGGSSEDIIPSVHVSISYENLLMEYKEQERGGQLSTKTYVGQWNLTG